MSEMADFIKADPGSTKAKMDDKEAPPGAAGWRSVLDSEWAEAKRQGLLDAIEVVEEQATRSWPDVAAFALEVTTSLRERRKMLEERP